MCFDHNICIYLIAAGHFLHIGIATFGATSEPYLAWTLSHLNLIKLEPYHAGTLSHLNLITLEPYHAGTSSHLNLIALAPYTTWALSHSNHIAASPYHTKTCASLGPSQQTASQQGLSCTLHTCKRFPIKSMAKLLISFHGWGGYIKAAFWICSLMSSSSLKGNVPDKLT